jgi:membrane protein insertase Oxa1/YidC/SpoIIIJ
VVGVKKRDNWGLAIAALTLAVLAVIVGATFYLGIRGLF